MNWVIKLDNITSEEVISACKKMDGFEKSSNEFIFPARREDHRFHIIIKEDTVNIHKDSKIHTQIRGLKAEEDCYRLKYRIISIIEQKRFYENRKWWQFWKPKKYKFKAI